jgi:hypothetical protein
VPAYYLLAGGLEREFPCQPDERYSKGQNFNPAYHAFPLSYVHAGARCREQGFTGCGKNGFICHPERSEGSAFSQPPGKKQIPQANPALGMTGLEFFRSLFKERKSKLIF